MIDLKNKGVRDALRRNIASGAVVYLFGNQVALDMLDAIGALETELGDVHQTLALSRGAVDRLERDLDKVRGVGVAPAMQELANRNERQAEMIASRDKEICRLNTTLSARADEIRKFLSQADAADRRAGDLSAKLLEATMQKGDLTQKLDAMRCALDAERSARLRAQKNPPSTVTLLAWEELNDRYQLACRELKTYRDGVTMFREMLGI